VLRQCHLDILSSSPRNATERSQENTREKYPPDHEKVSEKQIRESLPGRLETECRLVTIEREPVFDDEVVQMQDSAARRR